MLDTFWTQAITGADQLRQRVAFALSEIFVVSQLTGTINQRPRGLADHLDMLGREGFGTFRTLLERVSLHPIMGLYLSHLLNQKEEPATGRVPDENYSREVMQLFTIGLYQLNADGSYRLGGAGQRIPTYTNADVMGLARVFTGWSWAGPDASAQRFFGGQADPDRDVLPKPQPRYRLERKLVHSGRPPSVRLDQPDHRDAWRERHGRTVGNPRSSRKHRHRMRSGRMDRTAEAIAALDRRFAAIILELVNTARSYGIPVVLAPANARRTTAQHQANVAAGRSWTQRSRHVLGLAVDLDLYGFPPDSVPLEYWQWLGELGEAYGLRWCGRWKQRDWRHFEM